MNSDIDIRKLIEFAKTLDPETIRSNPNLAVLLNLELADCPNLQLATSLKVRFDRYRKQTKSTGLSAHTKRSYASRINSFTGWLSTAEEDYSKFFEDIECRSRAALAYKQYLQERCSESPNTVNAFLTTLTHFCAALNLESPAIKHESRRHHRLKRLSSEDQSLVLQMADRSKPQTRAIIYLLLKAGLRGSECWTLNASDYERDQKAIAVLEPNEARQILPLDPDCDLVLHEWLVTRKDKVSKGERAMFVNPQGHRLSEVGLRKLVRTMGQRAGLEIHPNLLRQTWVANRIVDEREKRERKTSTNDDIYKEALRSLCNTATDAMATELP